MPLIQPSTTSMQLHPKRKPVKISQLRRSESYPKRLPIKPWLDFVLFIIFLQFSKAVPQSFNDDTCPAKSYRDLMTEPLRHTTHDSFPDVSSELIVSKSTKPTFNSLKTMIQQGHMPLKSEIREALIAFKKGQDPKKIDQTLSNIEKGVKVYRNFEAKLAYTNEFYDAIIDYFKTLHQEFFNVNLGILRKENKGKAPKKKALINRLLISAEIKKHIPVDPSNPDAKLITRLKKELLNSPKVFAVLNGIMPMVLFESHPAGPPMFDSKTFFHSLQNHIVSHFNSHLEYKEFYLKGSDVRYSILTTPFIMKDIEAAEHGVIPTLGLHSRIPQYQIDRFSRADEKMKNVYLIGGLGTHSRFDNGINAQSEPSRTKWTHRTQLEYMYALIAFLNLGGDIAPQ